MSSLGPNAPDSAYAKPFTTFPTLTRKTYDQWCYKMEFELGPELWKLIDGTETKPVLDPLQSDRSVAENLPAIEAYEKALKEWQTKNRDAMRIILPTIVEPEFSMIHGCQSASAVWDTRLELPRHISNSSVQYPRTVLRTQENIRRLHRRIHFKAFEII